MQFISKYMMTKERASFRCCSGPQNTARVDLKMDFSPGLIPKIRFKEELDGVMGTHSAPLNDHFIQTESRFRDQSWDAMHHVLHLPPQQWLSGVESDEWKAWN